MIKGIDLHLEDFFNSRDRKNRGCSTGFNLLDYCIHWFEPGLIILASRPHIPKREFAIDIVNRIAVGRPVTYFPYSEKAGSIAVQFLYQRADVAPINAGACMTDDDQKAVNTAIVMLAETKLYIHSSPPPSLKELLTFIRDDRRDKSEDPGLVVIDDLQSLVKAETGLYDPPMYEFSSIVATLNKIAEEYRQPILLLTNLSDTSRKKRWHPPGIQDLERSGVLALYTNAVIFLHLYELDHQYREYMCIVSKNIYPYPRTSFGVVYDESSRHFT